LPSGINVWPPRLWIEAFEDVLLYERFAVDEVDLIRGPFEHPQIAVARDVSEPVDCFAVALIINEHRRVDLVPIPRIVRMILEMALDIPGRGIERNCRGGK